MLKVIVISLPSRPSFEVPITSTPASIRREVARRYGLVINQKPFADRTWPMPHSWYAVQS